jgi:hypothetical protein
MTKADHRLFCPWSVQLVTTRLRFESFSVLRAAGSTAHAVESALTFSPESNNSCGDQATDTDTGADAKFGTQLKSWITHSSFSGTTSRFWPT